MCDCRMRKTDWFKKECEYRYEEFGTYSSKFLCVPQFQMSEPRSESSFLYYSQKKSPYAGKMKGIGIAA